MKENLKHAVILSGGGADGAYEVGVAKALFNGKAPWSNDVPVAPEIFTGTSIGSFNSSYLVSQWDDYGAAATGNLERVWLDVISKGGFRIRLDPMVYLDPRSYMKPLRLGLDFVEDNLFLGWDALQRFVHLVSGEEPILQRFLETFNLASFVCAGPWERTIRESIDFKKVRKSSRKLFVAATNWVLGELKIFRNQHMTDKMGPEAIRASSSVPGFYPIATVGSQAYVDGAVLMNTPLRPAVKAGADVLHVIYLNTEVRNMPVDTLRSTLDTLYRTQIIAWTEAVNRDIAQAESYNKGLELLDKEDDEIKRLVGAVESGLKDEAVAEIVHALGQRLQRSERGKKPAELRPLTIHRYFPPDGLDGALGFLDISRERIARLISEGFDDTVNHDCTANKCIRPKAHEHN